MKRVEQANCVKSSSRPSLGMHASTRRSWLAGVGALFAAEAVSSTKAFGDPSAGELAPPHSPWPYHPPGLRFVLEARVTIAPVIDVGDTSYGHRRIIPITGGTFHGPRLAGTVLDQGEDTQLDRPDGVTEIAARYTLRTREGVLVYVTNCGLIVPDEKAAHSAAFVPRYARTIPKLEAPRGSGYEWLNQTLYVGTLNPLPASEHAVVVRFFAVT